MFQNRNRLKPGLGVDFQKFVKSVLLRELKKYILNNSIKWLIQASGFFFFPSAALLLCSFWPVQGICFQSSMGTSSVMYYHRRWTELTHSVISSALQPSLLVMIIEAVGLGGLFLLVPYPFTVLACKWLVHAGAPMTAAKGVTVKENKISAQCLSLEFPTENIFCFILFSSVCICR